MSNEPQMDCVLSHGLLAGGVVGAALANSPGLVEKARERLVAIAANLLATIPFDAATMRGGLDLENAQENKNTPPPRFSRWPCAYVRRQPSGAF